MTLHVWEPLWSGAIICAGDVLMHQRAGLEAGEGFMVVIFCG